MRSLIAAASLMISAAFTFPELPCVAAQPLALASDFTFSSENECPAQPGEHRALKRRSWPPSLHDP